MTLDLESIARPIHGLEALSVCMSDVDLLYTLWTRSNDINVGEDVVALFGLMSRIRKEAFELMGLDDVGYQAQMQVKSHVLLFRHIRDDYLVVMVFQSQIAIGLTHIQANQIVKTLAEQLPVNPDGHRKHSLGMKRSSTSAEERAHNVLFPHTARQRDTTPTPARPVFTDHIQETPRPTSPVSAPQTRTYRELPSTTTSHAMAEDQHSNDKMPLYLNANSFQPEESRRAEAIIRYVQHEVGNRADAIVGLATQSRIPLTALQHPDALSIEQIKRLETAARTLLGVPHIPV